MTSELPITSITIDARCQPRMTMNPEVIDEYAAAMGEGRAFPPLTVFREGRVYWLADGFHRYAAAKQAHIPTITCEVFDGDQRDAILYSAGANADHGLRRSNLDKRKAVETLLNDPDWSQWSNVEIARRCNVSHELVRQVRVSVTSNIGSDTPNATRTYTDKHGNTSTMQTGNIGKTPTVPKVHGSVPSDVLNDLFGDPEDADPEQAPLPAAITWHEGDRKAADAAIRCWELVGDYDAQRVAYAVAAQGEDARQRTLGSIVDLRLWLADLANHLSVIGK